MTPPLLHVHVTVPPTAIVTSFAVNMSLVTETAAVRGAAVIFAWNVTGDPVRAGVDVAVTVSWPALAPSVCTVVATPLMAVAFDVGLLEPPPATTAQATAMPLTGFPCPSDALAP